MDATPAAPTLRREGLGKLGVKFYRYRNLIIKRWWILVLTVAAGLAYQGWVVSQKPRVFESTGQLLIRDELEGNNVSIGTKIGGTDNFVGTNLAMLKSPEVMGKARQELALRSPDLRGDMPEISASVVPKTQIFNVTGTGTSPEYTQRFVDATIKSFMEWRQASILDSLGTVNSGIKRHIDQTEKKLAASKAKLDSYVKENNMAFWSAQASASAEYLSGLKTKEATLRTELSRYETLTPDQLLVMPPAPISASRGGSSVITSTGNDGTPTAESTTPISANLYQAYLQRSQELSMAQNRLDERSKVWKPKHPRLMALKEDVAQIQKGIEVLKQQNREATAQRVDAIKAELASLASSIKDWQAKVAEASQKDGEYQTLTADVTRINDTLNDAYKSDQGRDLTMDAFTKLQDATPSVEVDKGLKKHLTTGLLGGFAIGLLILILLDRADDRMTSSSEILDQFSESILGQIPNVSDSRGAAGLPLLQHDDERYTYAEAFRSLRSSLIFMPNQTELRTILVTSAIPNEGKSTITSNLAITMANSGANVVVVDADLRRGDLASLFDMDGRTGLSNVLRGESPWQLAIQQTRYPNLSLIPRGPVTNQSSELLLLPSIHTLLDDLRDNFDLIIFNTAPILATDDTPSLSPNFDGTVMVMRAQFTSARLTQNALNALYARQVNVLGLILNCVDTEMPDYYYYRYPKYYATQ